MKFKYVFIVFIIVIALLAVYFLYFNKSNNEEEIEIEKKDMSISEDAKLDLRFAVSNFDSINPLISNNKEILNIDKFIFEPLVTISPDYKIELVLASECSKISDTSYIIKIDNKKKWHNGDYFTANDISFTIDILKQGKSVYSYNVQSILNTEVIDSATIRINLLQPVSFFEYYLTFPILPSQYYLEEDFYNSNKLPLGTGMFKISEINDNNIILLRNDDWWNKENLPKVQKINIKKCNQIGEVYNSFKMKNIDIFTTYNINLENYIGTMGYYKQEIKARKYNYLSINNEDNILKYKEVRQAINYSIDRVNLVSTVFNNNVCISKYPLDFGCFLYNDEILNTEYSLDLARKVLNENGWEYKNGNWQKKEGYTTLKLNFKLTVNSNDIDKVKVAENIKNQLAQLGIKITINKVNETKYYEIIANKNYELLLTGIYNSYSPNVELYFAQGNLENYNNEEVLNLLGEIRNITDEKTLKEKYDRIETIYKDEMPFISLYREKIYVVKSQNLAGELKANNFYSYYGINDWYRF